MPNAFALLGLPRAAALDLEALQQAYRDASRSAHPDQPGGATARAAEINAAYETLQTPEKRLKHLLDLHQVPWRAVPIDDAMMALFSQLGPTLQNVAAFLKRRQAATSALAKALLAPEEMRLREQLEALGITLDAERSALLEDLPTFDSRLTSSDATALADLQTLQARLAYHGKWQAQVREALLNLM
ncbi:MAG: J domain-containing protein [Prosthecobacter sp.]|uniref:J domain-containing protein n=1 Tax=Prosthecobacter sp. TaxID=1965333 RepID=UPI0038FD6BD7